MTPRQFDELQSVVRKEREAADERRFFCAGVVASVVANVNRDPKKKREPFTPQDFMPQGAPKPKKKQAVEEQIALATAITRANKGKVVK